MRKFIIVLVFVIVIVLHAFIKKTITQMHCHLSDAKSEGREKGGSTAEMYRKNILIYIYIWKKVKKN